MKHRYYILNKEHEATPCSLFEWARYFETMDRYVADDQIGDVRISTVFLGLNHQWREDGDPLLFETMIFGRAYDGYPVRCSTWEQALVQHSDAVVMVKFPELQESK